MSANISGTTISMTRGDTVRVAINFVEYIPIEGDLIEFGVKEAYDDIDCLFTKQVPIDSLVLQIDPEDTKDLDFGTYVYDIQLTMTDGTVDTFITKAKLRIMEEVV